MTDGRPGDEPRTPDDQISIVLCTMGSRREDLRACLGSLARVRGIEAHEILVVTRTGDDLDDVRDEFASRLPLRMLQAPSEALSVKRNVASREARGDLIAFLDDDTLVAPSYAVALQNAFTPGVDCVGGVLEPMFDEEPEAELREAAFRIGGFNRWRGETRPDAWAGANCAFRRASLLEAGPFDERLGAGAPYLPWGEDSEMFRRFEGRGAFARSVVVRHRIQARRTKVGYVLQRAYLNGKTRCVNDYLHQEDFWRRAIVIPVMLAHAFLSMLGPRDRLEKRIRVRRLAGYVLQLLPLALQTFERPDRRLPRTPERVPAVEPMPAATVDRSEELPVGDARVSVVICTMRSRLADLGECLASLAEVSEIADQEILLVIREGDSLAGLQVPPDLPVRILHAPSEGLSAKRNVGCREASGALVAYLDDDAIVGPDYVRRIRTAFRPGIDCVAGVLEPRFEVEPGDRLRDSEFQIGGFNRWKGQTRVGAGIGANCVFRRTRLLATGAFDLRLGPGGTYLPWGDDSEMFRRFARDDRLGFAPGLVVRHRIQKERVTVEYVLTRAFRNGRVQCVIDRLHHVDFWRRAAGVPWMLALALAGRVFSKGGLSRSIRVRRLTGYLCQAGLILLGALPPEPRQEGDPDRQRGK